MTIQGDDMSNPDQSPASPELDEYARACAFAREKASVAYVQRKMGTIGFMRAIEYMERMISDGVISTYAGRNLERMVATEAAAMAATVLAGWQVVPTSSTAAMQWAFDRANVRFDDGTGRTHPMDPASEFKARYAALLAAAPQAPVAGQPAEPSPAEPLSDTQIKAAVHSAVKAGKLSWAGYEKDEAGEYTVPVLSPKHYQLARVIESTLAAPKGDSNG